MKVKLKKGHQEIYDELERKKNKVDSYFDDKPREHKEAAVMAGKTQVIKEMMEFVEGLGEPIREPIESNALSPNDIMGNLDKIIPKFVITAVNNLLTRNYRGHSVVLKQDEIIKEILNISSASKQRIFDNNWLDFETIFRDKGWSVSFEKPTMGDSFDARFTFKPIKK